MSKNDWPGLIKVEANDRMPEGEFALVSGDSVSIAYLDGQPQRELKGTELRRFLRWILRARTPTPESSK